MMLHKKTKQGNDIGKPSKIDDILRRMHMRDTELYRRLEILEKEAGVVSVRSIEPRQFN